MSNVKIYDYTKDGDLYISKHFQVKEFASIDGNGILYSNIVMIDMDLVELLERLFEYMNATKIVITSGYRTNAHELTLSNSAKNGYHTKGRAVDINVWKGSKRFSAKEIVLAIEDLGWNKGLALITTTAVHVDTRDSKYFFNETKGNVKIGDSFYTYYGEKSLREKVKTRFGFDEDVTMKYLDKHPYPQSLYYKLANGK